MSPAGLTSGALVFDGFDTWPPPADDEAPHPAAPIATITAPAASAARLDMRPPEVGLLAITRRPYGSPVNAPPASGQRPVNVQRRAALRPSTHARASSATGRVPTRRRSRGDH